jgi:hypothetical protein
LSTGSRVYLRLDGLEKHCIQLAPMLDKNRASRKLAASAHPTLWICRGFSTDAGKSSGFSCLNGKFNAGFQLGRPRTSFPVLQLTDHFFFL